MATDFFDIPLIERWGLLLLPLNLNCPQLPSWPIKIGQESRYDILGLPRLKHKEPYSSFLGLLKHSFLDPEPLCKKSTFHGEAAMRPHGEGRGWLSPAFWLSAPKCHVWDWSYLGAYKPIQPPSGYHQVIPADTVWSRRITHPSPTWIPDPQIIIKQRLFQATKFQGRLWWSDR